jgi:hypothetical protein
MSFRKFLELEMASTLHWKYEKPIQQLQTSSTTNNAQFNANASDSDAAGDERREVPSTDETVGSRLYFTPQADIISKFRTYQI